jgi:DNA processing protein
MSLNAFEPPASSATCRAEELATRDRQARIILSQLAEPGDAQLCDLVSDRGAVATLAAIEAKTPNLPRVEDWLVRRRAVDVSGTIHRASRVGARFVTPLDDEWPHQIDDLRHVAPRDRRGGVPIGLWVRGGRRLASTTTSAVAIVGSRSATAYGEHVAQDLAAGCSEEGFTVVSGGAYGIDAAAHRGAMVARQPTVAVLAGGVDRLYPRGNSALLEHVLADGLLVSESPPGANPIRTRFLSRNRIIAALSLGTVVVEAALRSGALSTARWAAELGRETMGVPGKVTSASSGGVHQFIRETGAVLVTRTAEVVEQLSLMGQRLTRHQSAPERERDGLDLLARQILDALPVSRPVSTEQIAIATGTRAQMVADRLRVLRTAGHVIHVDGLWMLQRDLAR